MKKLLYPLFVTALMFISGCGDSLYEVYNDFTGPVESVALPKTASIVIDTTERLDAKVYPSMTENKNVTWTSVDGTGQITIDQYGNVKGEAVGDATVTVKTVESGFTAQCVVTVVPVPIPIESILLPATFSIGKGLPGTLVPDITPKKPTSADLTWTSDNIAVAAVTGQVDGSGIVSGVNNGTATITVTSAHWNKSAFCVVTVGTPEYSVTYKKNNGTADEVIGSAQYKTGFPFTVYPGNTFTREHYTFNGWKTGADGTGASYDAGADYPMGSVNVVLYAQWSLNFYKVTYSIGAGSSGTVPSEVTYNSGSTVTVLGNTGNLIGPEVGGVHTGKGIKQTFLGWNTVPSATAVQYAAGITFVISGDTNLYAIYTNDTSVLRKVGPAGGWIFYYLDTATWGKYLEAAPVDIPGLYYWYDTYGGVAVVGTSQVIGTGSVNTSKLGVKFPAAQACKAYSYGGYSAGSWFLPSQGELNEMYNNLKVFGIGGFAGESYWSSSEYDIYDAYYQFFTNGSVSRNPKNFYSKSVRAVRAF